MRDPMSDEQRQAGIEKHNAVARATGKPIHFQYGVYGPGETRMTFNACVFATKDEAWRAGFELQCRWSGMSGFDAVETNDAISYEFPPDAPRPISIPLADRK